MSLTVKELNAIIKELAFGAKRTVFGREANEIRKRAKPDIDQKLKEGAIIDLLIEVEEEEDEQKPARDRKKKERKRAFCGTGKDGGLDNSCSPANKGASMESVTGSGDPSDSLGGDLSRPVPMPGQAWLPFITPDDQKNYKLEQAAAVSNKMVETIISQIEEGLPEGEEVMVSWNDIDEDEQQEAQSSWEQDNFSEKYSELMDQAKDDFLMDKENAAEDDWEDAWTDGNAEDKLMEIWEDKKAQFQKNYLVSDSAIEAMTPEIDGGDYSFDEDAAKEAGISDEHFEIFTSLMVAEQQEAKREFKQSYIEQAKETAESDWESESDNISDNLSQNVYEDLSSEWYNMSDDEKLEASGYSATELKDIELPGEWKIAKNGEDYKKTRNVVRYVQKRVMRETLEARGLPDSINHEEAIASSWVSWKQSSTSSAGLLMQDCTAEELGGRKQDWSDEQKKLIDQAALRFTTEYGGQTKEELNAMGREGGIKFGREIMKAHIRGTWAATQYALKQSGSDKVYLYRAVLIDKDLVKGQGITIDVDLKTRKEEFKTLPELKLKRNGLASTAMGREGLGVANNWNGVDLKKPRDQYARVVLRIEAPREAVVSIPAFGQNIHAEQEAVIAGMKYKWDAFLDRAPYHEEHEIGKHL
jgi:hypothetical protein